MPNGEDSSGYDPIMGVQPANPTDVMTFSMLKRPKDSPKTGGPVKWPRHPFDIEIVDYTFKRWKDGDWIAVTGPEDPFIVDPSVKGTSDKITGNEQFVIPLGSNKDYGEGFPACIEVDFKTKGPGKEFVDHMGRAVRFD